MSFKYLTGPTHAARMNVARSLCPHTFPCGEEDPYLPNIVGYIRTFASDDADPMQIADMVNQTLAMFVALGALQA
jgi:hypothetical protein